MLSIYCTNEFIEFLVVNFQHVVIKLDNDRVSFRETKFCFAFCFQPYLLFIRKTGHVNIFPGEGRTKKNESQKYTQNFFEPAGFSRDIRNEWSKGLRMPTKFIVIIQNNMKSRQSSSDKEFVEVYSENFSSLSAISALILVSCVVKKKRSKQSQNSSFGYYCFGHDAFLALQEHIWTFLKCHLLERLEGWEALRSDSWHLVTRPTIGRWLHNLLWGSTRYTLSGANLIFRRSVPLQPRCTHSACQFFCSILMIPRTMCLDFLISLEKEVHAPLLVRVNQ